MTRKIPPQLIQADIPQPKVPPSVTIELPLRLITPMVGGGAESKSLHEITPIRASAIRGNLRYWWRALRGDLETNEILYQHEYAIWGGQKPDTGSESNDEKTQTWKSPISIRVVLPGQVNLKTVSAGYHQYRANQRRHSPFARWSRELPDSAGYALFPLQKTSKQLRDAGNADMALNELAIAGEFALQVCIQNRRKITDSESTPVCPLYLPEFKQLCDEVCACLAMWITFGGLGARTRRGFGAIELCNAASVEQGEGLKWVMPDVIENMQKATWSAAQIIRAAVKMVGNPSSVGPPQWPVISEGESDKNASVFCGNPCNTAKDAHQLLLQAAVSFYQRPPTGRKHGDSANRPGRSNWPEADSFKLLRGRRDYEHRPVLDKNFVSAPRAARGMPLRITFKDSNEKAANGEVVPAEGDRLPSPLVFSVLRTSDNQFLPIVLKMDIPVVKAEVKFDSDRNKSIAVRTRLDAKNNLDSNWDAPIDVGEDAVEGFMRFLKDKLKSRDE